MVDPQIALRIIRSKFQPLNLQLSDLDIVIIRGSLAEKSYAAIAQEIERNPSYIRFKGSQLFKKISRAFKRKIGKDNLQSVLENYCNLEEEGESQQPLQQKVIDLGKTIDIPIFLNRQQELALLLKAILDHHSPLVNIFGMKGIGKTMLSVKLTQELLDYFDIISWQSLNDFYKFADLSQHYFSLLSQSQAIQAAATAQIEQFIRLLQQYRCLLVLDNFEVILATNSQEEANHTYLQLLQEISQVNHQSCVVVVSQKQPEILEQLMIQNPKIYSQQLRGLPEAESRQLLENQMNISGSPRNWEVFLKYYDGNPLVLKIMGGIIRECFDSSLNLFMDYLEQETIIFDEIKSLFITQLDNLSQQDQSVMFWLAICFNIESAEALSHLMIEKISPQEVATVLRSLERRSLVECKDSGFTQQPVIRDYLLHILVEQITQEILEQDFNFIETHCLYQAEARNSIQQHQLQLIIQPILAKLQLALQTPEQRLLRLLNRLETQPLRQRGYDVVNLSQLWHYAQID